MRRGVGVRNKAQGMGGGTGGRGEGIKKIRQQNFK